MKERSLFLRKKDKKDEDMCVIFSGNHDFKYSTPICRRVIEEMFAILAGNHDFDFRRRSKIDGKQRKRLISGESRRRSGRGEMKYVQYPSYPIYNMLLPPRTIRREGAACADNKPTHHPLGNRPHCRARSSPECTE